MPDRHVQRDSIDTAAAAALSPAVVLQAWRRVPPVLRGHDVVLREPRLDDAASLVDLLGADDIARFLPGAVTSVATAERAVDFLREQREAGEALCLAMVPAACRAPAGLFVLRQLEGAFGIAEWSFALGRQYWGEGLFHAAASLVIEYTFDVLGARRLEARAAVCNGRGHGALKKLGAVQEALLREAVEQDDGPADQVLWALLADDWRALGPARKLRVH
jgi:RimJ/RimL family protein N-acetyltransferase